MSIRLNSAYVYCRDSRPSIHAHSMAWQARKLSARPATRAGTPATGMTTPHVALQRNPEPFLNTPGSSVTWSRAMRRTLRVIRS